jgi:hypothetical protein
MSVTSIIDEEKVKSLLDAILKNIQTEADPQLLNQYRSLIRKNVSFFQRSYLAAYLLMLQDQSQGRHRRSGGGDRSRGKVKHRNDFAVNGVEPGEATESARQGQRPILQAPAVVALPEDESTWLFISVGRNRRVFPREILGLIYAKTSVSKEDIGTITILNNYSFVQVRNSVAAELLETLNGATFRGKTLAVNYAKTRKKDDNDFSEEPELKPPERDTPYIDDVDNPYDEVGGKDDPGEGDDSGETATE